MRGEEENAMICAMKMTETPPNFSLKVRELASSSRMIDILPMISSHRIGIKDYYHWEELAYREAPNGLTRDEWWVVMKICRNAQRRETSIPFGADSTFWWTMPDSLIKRLHEIDVKSGISVRHDARKIVNDATEKYLRETSPLFEAVTSSQLEGSPTTWSDAKRMIRTGRAPRDVGERMILNNYQAMQLILEKYEQPLTTDFILELHRILTHDTLEKQDAEGRYRRADEYVRVADDETVFHVPPPASQLAADMEALCAFANGYGNDGMYMPDIVRAAVLHFWMGYEHPFCDGNGRVARALMYWSLLRSGYSIFEFVSISNILKKAPAKYVRAFTYVETDDGDLTYFLLHQTDAILRALDEFRSYVRKKEQAMHAAESLLDGCDLTLRQKTIVARAIRNPGESFRIADCQRICGVSYATARSEMIQLQQAGLMEMRKQGNAFVYYPMANLLEKLPYVTKKEKA